VLLCRTRRLINDVACIIEIVFREKLVLAKVFLTWVCWLVALTFLVAVTAVLYLCATFGTGNSWAIILVGVSSLLIVFSLYKALSRSKMAANLSKAIDEDASQLWGFIEKLSPHNVALGIAASAGVGLLLELSLIRWQGTLFLLFAYYKNFSLLSCFAGLGLGYAVADRKQIPLSLTFPLLALQIFFLIFLRYSFGQTLNFALEIMPISEQYHLSLPAIHSVVQFGIVYFFLSTVFLLTALTLLPVGQLCGALMRRQNPLKAYGLNLAGSLLGVALSFGLSFLWTPPIVWFSLAICLLLVFQVYNPRSLLVSTVASFVAIAILAWPVYYLSEVVYSPYQIVERTCNKRGWMFIKAGGQYYQRTHNLSPESIQAFPELKSGALSYNLPYMVLQKPPTDVAIMAAGTGNDVAAALRAGAQHIDAVEIDPSILGFGKAYHPEHPYESPKVTAILDDARAFMRTSKKQYDLISFSALDSHTLLSHASSLRLDSYVYTIESFRDARAHLKPGGLLCLSFDKASPQILAKIYLMLEKTFDGKPPVCIDGTELPCTFMQTKEADLQLSSSLFSNESLLHDAAPEIRKLGIKDVDVSTDDWPFFYMYKRVYPFSYMGMFGVVALLTLILAASFNSVGKAAGNYAGTYWSCLLLGAGFMLIETKAITELSLAFSNTWYVVGIVIAAIMVMAFLANLLVSQFKLRHAFLPYCLLLLSLAGGLWVAHSGWLPATSTDKVLQIVILIMPVFFSGMVFSILLGAVADIAPAMAMNLMGAMLGALLEYNAMYFGYKALYVIAIVIYGVAFLLLRSCPGKSSDQGQPITSASGE